MNRQPLVSVLLPVGKDRRFLAEAVGSIKNQSYKPTELLVGEDKDEEGITGILIKLAKKAKGKFLARMDADDISEPDRIEKQVEFMKLNSDVVLVGTWATLINESGKKIGLQKMPTGWEEIKNQAFYRNPLVHSSWMIRKEWFEKIGGYNPKYRYSQDWELLLRTVWKYQIKNIPGSLIKLRIHKKSSSFTHNKEQIWCGMRARFEVVKRGDIPFWKVIFLLPRFLSLLIPISFKYFYRGQSFKDSPCKDCPYGTYGIGIVLPIGQNRKWLEKSGQWSLWESELVEYRKVFDSVELFEYRYCDWRRFVEAVISPIVEKERFKNCSVLKAVHLTGAIPCLTAKLLYGVPYVLSYGYRYDEFAAVERKWGAWFLSKLLTPMAIKFANAVMVPTKALADYVEWVGTKRIEVVPNGVDVRKFSPNSEFRIQNSELNILFVGRLEKQKNLETLIRAITFQGRTLRYNLVFVGAGSLKDELVELANKPGVNLEIKEPIANEKLPEVYRQADIFVLPSWAEGHPKALLEAMSCGLACMASNIPGVNEIIVDGKNGLLVEPTVEGIASGLEKLAGNSELRKRLGSAARKIVVEKFDKKKLMEREIRSLLAAGQGDSFKNT